MFKKYKDFNIDKIEHDHEYDCKFEDGHVENILGQELHECSQSQGCIYIYKIKQVKDIGKLSKEEFNERIKSEEEYHNEVNRIIKEAAKEHAERVSRVRDKFKLTDEFLKSLGPAGCHELCADLKKKNPEDRLELDWIFRMFTKDLW